MAVEEVAAVDAGVVAVAAVLPPLHQLVAEVRSPPAVAVLAERSAAEVVAMAVAGRSAVEAVAMAAAGPSAVVVAAVARVVHASAAATVVATEPCGQAGVTGQGGSIAQDEETVETVQGAKLVTVAGSRRYCAMVATSGAKLATAAGAVTIAATSGSTASGTPGVPASASTSTMATTMVTAIG